MGRSKKFGIVSVLILTGGIAFVAFAASRQKSKGRPNTVGEVKTDDRPLSDDVRHFIEILNTVENEDDKRYLAAIERLRGRGAKFVEEARRLVSTDPDLEYQDFALEHSVMLAVSALREPGALQLLSEVALNPQPIPPHEASAARDPFDTPPEHRLDTEATVQRTIVALDAVDGIDLLARDGHAEALDALVKVSGSSSNAVCAAALTALGARPEWRDHYAKAVANLPDDLRHLAHLSRKTVAEVPQIRDPRATLIGTGDATTRAPGLDDETGFQRSAVPGAPRVGRR